MNKIERREKELELLKAEDDFAKKKAEGKATQKDKDALRELRQDYRDNYRTPKPGASPEPIKTGAKAKKAGS